VGAVAGVLLLQTVFLVGQVVAVAMGLLLVVQELQDKAMLAVQPQLTITLVVAVELGQLAHLDQVAMELRLVVREA
jgi:hypothetical protein